MGGLYAVIMAGGRGSRFWPRSRKKCSKQTLNIIGKNTMIQDTVHRISLVIPKEKIIIITNDLLKNEIQKQVSQIPPENVIAEPSSRSTAPCIGYAAVMLEKRDPDAVIACFAADHLVENEDRFVENIKFAHKIAVERDQLVVFGIPPKRPDTGFGYVHAGEILAEEGAESARKVIEFVEKPNLETAEKFVKDKSHFINSGMFVWKAGTFLNEMKKFLPDMHAGLMRIRESIGTPLEIKTIVEEFDGFQSISVDHGILEKSKNVAMVPAGFGWDDIGSWESLYHVWPKDKQGNAGVGRKLAIDTKNCLVYSPNKFVATIGLEDVIIVETDDALLVCKKENAQDVSRVIEELRKLRWEEYL